MQRVYLDNAATTMVRQEAVEAMMLAFSESYGNPSSLHGYAREAARLLGQSRERVAEAIGALAEEIVFTSGGSESDNMLLYGVAKAYSAKGRHIITSAVEHHAVLHTLQDMEKAGLITLTVLPVDPYGRISPAALEAVIRPDTVLVSVMFANNEVGTLMPVVEIGRICREHGVLFHTDAVQAAGHVKIDVNEMNIDLLSLSAHKFHGPKGVGAAYIRTGVHVQPLILGGGQERNRRAGTENVPGIAGMSAALAYAAAHLDENAKKVSALRDRLLAGILREIPGTQLNGHPHERLPNNVNVSIRGAAAKSLLPLLDMNGIAASSGSACTSGLLEPSHVLHAMGMPDELAECSLRLTLSEFTSSEEIEYTLKLLSETVARLRSIQ